MMRIGEIAVGWSIYFSSNKEIKDTEIDQIVENLPKKFSFSLGNHRQPWGWSTGADISRRYENSISLSGSYGASGQIAEAYSEFLKVELEKYDHRIKVKYNL
ncbi:hypothetical protein EBB07_29080 [Paenibacillaceae bacterium]|nr:hypothetical protein EBB07_29080 [Paenibacillaceae bacterium]